MEQTHASNGYKRSIPRSSSHSDLQSSPASDAKSSPEQSQECKTAGRLSNALELNSATNLAMSWPPPRVLVPEEATRGGCFIPSPDQDDYGRRLMSRMAVQRLAPTASPKSRECALLLRSVSALPALPTNPSPQGNLNPDGVNSPSSMAALDLNQGNAPSLDTNAALLPNLRASSSALLVKSSGIRKEETESLALVQSVGPIAEDSVLEEEDSSRGVLLAAAEAPSCTQSQPQSRTQPLDIVETKSTSTNFRTTLVTRRDQEPRSQSLTNSLPSQSVESLLKRPPPKPPISHPLPKPPLFPVAEVSTSGSSAPRPVFQGPPGFPARDRISSNPPRAPPIPSDEYADSQLEKPSTDTRNTYLQGLIRGVHTDAAARSRLHLSSSANELRDGDPEGPSSDTESSSLGRLSESRAEEGEGNEGWRSGLLRTNSLPQEYRDQYLVSNDEELEWEREEAGIGRNSQRPSAVTRSSSKANGSSSHPHKRPRLILHLDINKTILIKDTAQDAGSESMVNVLLSECAWGRLLPGPCWIPVGRLATDKPANDPELMTYRSYLDTFYLPLQRGFGPEIDHANEDIKHRRQALKRCFTAPGEPGAMFRGVYDKLLEELQVAESKQAAMRVCGLGDGKEIVLLPSFFELLKHLKNSGRDFAIVFRTFGSDVMDVSRELNLFCEGRHPFHPGVQMDGQDGPTDLRLRSRSQYGCFYRQGFGPEGTMLAFSPPEEALRKHIARLDELEQCGECHWSFREIYNAMIARCLEGGNIALAFRDYYPWWKAHQERARTGKLLLVDKDDLHNRQIFFDDNIGTGSPHIVDVRDVSTGEPIPFAESSGKYLVKVEPLNAILDRQYFIRAVHRCEESIEGARDWRGFRNTPRLKNSKWDVARRKLLSIIRLGSGQN